MKNNSYKLSLTLILLLWFVNTSVFSQEVTPKLWNNNIEKLSSSDWLINATDKKAAVYQDKNKLILYNGLVKRSFMIKPDVACFDFKNMSNGQQLLRSIKPEASVQINGKTANIGGLVGQKENAYITNAMLDELKADGQDFKFESYKVDTLPLFINWKAGKLWSGNSKNPSGIMLTFKYVGYSSNFKGFVVKVNYALYDGIPLITKWLTIDNNTNTTAKIGQVKNEILGIVEEESAVVGATDKMKPQHGIYVETNYAFNNAMRYDLSDQTTHWKADSTYTSQVNYDFLTPCLLEIYPNKAPNVELKAGETFTPIRSNELLIDTYDRERRGLSIRKMYRTIAPWTTENPIFMHLISKNDAEVFSAIDQCAATGYEALILSFGSHLNMEDSSLVNINKWKKIADYAHAKRIIIGGYSLFSSRKISDADDVINPLTGKPGGAFFGNAPCFGSNWGLAYRDKIKYFFSKTGFDIWENDGPYPGDVCASTTHPGHSGLEDSQWKQIEIQKELYHWLNEKGVYINSPDWYFLDGTHKTGLGYREINFSLPRANQKILNRQNIYDGTWEKLPSMGWGFVPLMAYQGGGPEAVLEPLSSHLEDYKQLMIQYYGAGVQACYRGSRLYDTEETKKTVIEVINWYKKYRDILNSDIIHLRRADGRDWDGILHVNPNLKTKGFMMLYNPLKERITRKITIPLYYTGINDRAIVAEQKGVKKEIKLKPNKTIDITVELSPESYTWYSVE